MDYKLHLDAYQVTSTHRTAPVLPSFTLTSLRKPGTSIPRSPLVMGTTATPSRPEAPRAKKPRSAGPPKPAGLEFVTICHPDDIKERNTRRKISRHVMKDIGASRRRKRVHDGALSKSQFPEPSNSDGTGALSISEPQDIPPRDPFELSPISILSRHFAARAQKISRFCIETRLVATCNPLTVCSDAARLANVLETAQALLHPCHDG